ncbi:group 1 truncated hemoglobin [Hymenobacter caeli]|uniref:Hemoglobin n=1 Tax=Hymenobacter caeli TaxID=2735894 RepID=A0ABX2FQS7_9BACT|nr:group 1 truncated hemoglobin [Hymenobacter caeli]NRT19528.1 hemoglobin [Hymenobacter caeli]
MKIFLPVRKSLLAGALLLAATACSKSSDPAPAPAPAPATLYSRLGNVDGVSKVVDSFLANVIAESQTSNSSLKRTFNPLLTSGNAQRVTLLRDNLIDQIGQATGGPLVYKGLTMTAAHKGMAITTQEFGVFGVAFTKALTDNGVKDPEKTELLTIITSLQSQVVGQ